MKCDYARSAEHLQDELPNVSKVSKWNAAFQPFLDDPFNLWFISFMNSSSFSKPPLIRLFRRFLYEDTLSNLVVYKVPFAIPSFCVSFLHFFCLSPSTLNQFLHESRPPLSLGQYYILKISFAKSACTENLSFCANPVRNSKSQTLFLKIP